MKNISKSIIITGMLALTPVLAASPASAAPLNIDKVLQQKGITLSCFDNNFKLSQQGNEQWEQNLTDIVNKLIQKNKPASDTTISTPNNSVTTPPVTEGKTELTPQPEVNKPVVNKPEVTKPEATKPEITVPEVVQPEAPKESAKVPETETATEQKPTNKIDQNEDANIDFAQQVVDLVNQERAKGGLQPLKNDKALANVAMIKAKDMYNNNYFDHNSPTLGSPFDLMKSEGVQYRTAGENIAKGQKTPQEVMKAWMNSEGHRQNIMSPNYTSIGVAYYNGEWVQAFTG